ncbi:hypothetical protein EYC80_000290 [Monilinia laxa]|uniref:Uncharacterized protein n=1 Tax=Monilinia laxa TaxID=61186 RepID=A0A5N6KAB9_MONLA|nr:hypothetical protein EYC80_000290 [Monilinia laxa]
MRPFRRIHLLPSKNKYYRPHATRTESLLILLIITLLIIGLLEYSCHVIPQHSGFGSTAEEFVNMTRSKLEARGGNEYRRAAAEPSLSSATTSTPLVPVLVPSDSTYSTPRTSPAGFTIDSTTVPLTAAGSSYLTPKETTTLPESTLFIATHLTPSSLQSVEVTDPTPETSTSVRATYLTPGSVAKTDGTYMTPDPTIPLPSTSAPGMVIPSSKTTTPSPIVLIPTVSITSDYTSTITVPSSSISNAGPPPVVVPVTSNYISTITAPPPSNPNNAPSPIVVPITSDYISTITIFNPTASNKRLSSNEPETKVNTPIFKSDQKVSDATSVKLITLTSSVIDSDGSFAELTTITSSSLVHLFPSTTNMPQNEPTTSNPTSALIETNPADSSMLVIVSTFRSVYESTIFPTSSDIIVDKPVATSANSSGTFIYHSNGNVTAPDQITYRQYLIASFLPLFLAIFYAIPWRIMENTVRYMEPFYQFRPFSHYTESQAIHLDYESSSTFIIPFKSISRKHFTMFASSLISIIILVIAPIASQVMIIFESNYCEGTGLTTCDSWGIYPSFARMLEGLLSAIVVLILFLIFAGLRRDTGVYSEPLSLIGLAVIYIKTPLSFQAADNNSGLREDRSRIAVQNYTSLLAHEAETTQATQSSTLLRSKRRERYEKDKSYQRYGTKSRFD